MSIFSINSSIYKIGFWNDNITSTIAIYGSSSSSIRLSVRIEDGYTYVERHVDSDIKWRKQLS